MIDKISTARRLIRSGGWKSLAMRTWRYIWRTKVFSQPFKRIFGDTMYHKLYSSPMLGYWPRINNPRSFNEKILHRKLYTNFDIFTDVEDKYRVRKYVENKVGTHILPELYQVTHDPYEIDFNDLPQQFVIKPTHLSGPLKIVDDKSNLEFEQVRETCTKWLEMSYGDTNDEYWYQNIRPRIIIEERIKGDRGLAPIDYKFFVFHGDVKFIEVDMDRFVSHTRRFYDPEWNAQNFELKYPLGDKIDEPENLAEMVRIAEILGEDFDFIRVDLYDTDSNQVVFGELTVGHGSGSERFRPKSMDFELGKLW